MQTIAVFEAKSRLSEILSAVELGEEFTVTKRGLPIARIIPFDRSGQDEATHSARQALVDRCLLAREFAPVDNFDLRPAIEDGRR